MSFFSKNKDENKTNDFKSFDWLVNRKNRIQKKFL